MSGREWLRLIANEPAAPPAVATSGSYARVSVTWVAPNYLGDALPQCGNGACDCWEVEAMRWRPECRAEAT